jgi:hypothetical protein
MVSLFVIDNDNTGDNASTIDSDIYVDSSAFVVL